MKENYQKAILNMISKKICFSRKIQYFPSSRSETYVNYLIETYMTITVRLRYTTHFSEYNL